MSLKGLPLGVCRRRGREIRGALVGGVDFGPSGKERKSQGGFLEACRGGGGQKQPGGVSAPRGAS